MDAGFVKTETTAINAKLRDCQAKAAASWRRKETGGRTMQPNEMFWKVFAGIGIASVVIVFVVLAYDAFDALGGLVRDLRWQYKYKHRFDKPPTAKCYCKDCKWHSVKDNKCSDVTWADRYTPDNGFCYEAEPRKKDIDND